MCSIEFLSLLLLASAAFSLLPGPRTRRALFVAGNAAFLYVVQPQWWGLAAMAAFLLSGYAAGLALRRWPSRGGLAAYLAATLAAFVFLKRYDFLTLVLLADAFRYAVSIVGLTFVFFPAGLDRSVAVLAALVGVRI